MKVLTVELGARSYPIYIGETLISNAKLLAKHIVAQRAMIVSNKTVGALYLEKIEAALEPKSTDAILLPDGEQYKNLQTLEKIFDALLKKRHHRNTTLIAVGGGVICDMTGFAAACYQRGVSFIQIPTTLLAQVDASIGGKTAVNHPLGKNMIGAFHQPRCVIVDIATLNTLPTREFNAGLAEIVKAALIRDADFFVWLEKNIKKLLAKDPQSLIYAIERACTIKAQIVAADEKEISGTRALLNLGHTFGHALEQNLGYGKWLHGEAVAAGLVLAADLSARSGWISVDELRRIKELLSVIPLPIQLPAKLQYDKMLASMAVDKKMLDAEMKLVLLKAIGKAELIYKVNTRQVRQVLEDNIKKPL